MINYAKKLTVDREFYPLNSIDASYESDRGRILSSPAFRRLQKRTQVFPLELDAAVRSRLTHSLEVAQTSRYIAKTILKKLQNDKKIKNCGLEDLQEAFVSCAEMTSMVHDIGNPPFGHFAEEVISNWIRQKAIPIFNTLVHSLPQANIGLQEDIINDLSTFDGNAQSVRVITKLQRLNLSYSQIAAVLKYTRCGSEPKPPKEQALAYLRKKPGFYMSEKDIIEEVTSKLHIKKGHRFSITYIMEAADDISYLTADLEDAVDKGLLTLEQFVALVHDACNDINTRYNLQSNLLQEMVDTYYQKALDDDEPYRFNMFLTLLRAKLIGKLVEYVAQSYIDNHEAVFEGSLDKPLLESNPASQEALAVQVLQKISIKHIYNHKTIQNMELQSFQIVQGLLECFKPLLEVDFEAMERLRNDEKITPIIVPRLYGRLPQKQRIVYEAAVDSLQKHPHNEKVMLEWYHRVRLVLDYISGMTDDYALSEYKNLML